MVRNLERQRCGRVEDLYLADDYLNFTGRQVRVGVTSGRAVTSPVTFKYVFCAQIVGHLLTDDYLGNTAGITQVNKGDAPWSRRRSTQPVSVTVVPMSLERREPA